MRDPILDYIEKHFKETTMPKEDKKLIKNFLVSFKYTAPNGAIRSASRLLPAETIIQARENAMRNLAQDYDWFKIGKITQADSDHPQQSI